MCSTPATETSDLGTTWPQEALVRKGRASTNASCDRNRLPYFHIFVWIHSEIIRLGNPKSTGDTWEYLSKRSPCNRHFHSNRRLDTNYRRNTLQGVHIRRTT